MMRHLFIVAALGLVACRGLRGREFSGSYRHEGDNPEHAPECAGFSRVSVRDPRPEPNLVGDRAREDRPESQPLTMLGDVGAWVREGFEADAKQAGYTLETARNPSLVLTVNTVDMHETVGGNSGYRARIVLDAQLVLPNGQSCFSGSFEGAGKNWGSEGNPDNYRQTLNRTLDAVAVAMLNDRAVRDAACGQCPGGLTPPPMPAP